MAIKIEEYVTSEQKNYYAEWFNDLSVEYAAKVAAARARMMAGSMENVKPIDGTLKEYRIDWGPGIRIYLIHDGDCINRAAWRWNKKRSGCRYQAGEKIAR